MIEILDFDADVVAFISSHPDYPTRLVLVNKVGSGDQVLVSYRDYMLLEDEPLCIGDRVRIIAVEPRRGNYLRSYLVGRLHPQDATAVSDQRS